VDERWQHLSAAVFYVDEMAALSRLLQFFTWTRWQHLSAAVFLLAEILLTRRGDEVAVV
jgi:hypothetical protein